MSNTTFGPSPDDAGGVGSPRGTDPKLGSRIGPYRLLRLLGSGSTGRVYEVEHERLGRHAAMKMLSPEHAARPGSVRRLFHEARAVNRINNPHIVEVTDLVEDGELRPPVSDPEARVPAMARVNALVMELLEGQSLGQAMAGGGQAMAPARFLPLMAQVCRALAAAHGAGFAHRDLKPENIFLVERSGQEDFVKLLDFGLTKMVEADPMAPPLGVSGGPSNPALATLEGTFVGTPGYVSPEQAMGKAVDHRTDIYAVGVILFEIIAGHLPFEGLSVGDYLVKHVTEPPPPLPPAITATPLGRTLDGIVQRCLAKDPAGRFASASELAALLEELARGQDVTLPEVPRRSPTPVAETTPPRPPWRRRALAVGAGVGAAALLSIGTAALLGRLRAEPEAPRPVATPAAPAPVVAPPAAVTPPARVTLSFESDPQGAEVSLAGPDAAPPLALGTTPFERVFDRGDKALTIDFRLEGYETVRLSTSAADSRVVSVRLTRVAAPPPVPGHRPHEPGREADKGKRPDDGESPTARPPTARSPVDRETTINPFR